MLAWFVALLVGLSVPQTAASAAGQESAKAPQTTAEHKIDPEIAAKLLKVRRIYVESFGDDPVSKQLQAMVINALAESKRFIVTENKDKADAILKGSGLEKTSQELHALGESTSVGVAAGGQSGSVSGSVVNGTGSISGSSSGGFIAKKMASADVADQIVKQLLWDLDKLQGKKN